VESARKGLLPCCLLVAACRIRSSPSCLRGPVPPEARAASSFLMTLPDMGLAWMARARKFGECDLRATVACFAHRGLIAPTIRVTLLLVLRDSARRAEIWSGARCEYC
jgi:hypothetical protein